MRSVSVKTDRALDRLHELVAAARDSDTESCGAAAGAIGREEMLGLLEAQLRAVVPATTQPILAELAAVRALLVCNGRCFLLGLEWGREGGCSVGVVWSMSLVCSPLSYTNQPAAHGVAAESFLAQYCVIG